MPDEDPTPKIPEGYFTQAQLDEAIKAAKQTARTEERDKLYPAKDEQKKAFDAMQAEVAELRKAEGARAKEAERIQREAEKAKQAKADAEKSAKELLAEREQTWQQQLEAMQAAQDAKLAEIAQQREVDQAMMAKEREMQALQIYIRDRVAAESDSIAPELMDFIGGSTQEEVEASIQRVKDKTAAIVEGMRQAQISQRSGMPGVSPSGGATAVVPGLDTGDKQLTAEDIKNMPMAEYAKLRSQAGIAAAGNGRGIFG